MKDGFVFVTEVCDDMGRIAASFVGDLSTLSEIYKNSSTPELVPAAYYDAIHNGIVRVLDVQLLCGGLPYWHVVAGDYEYNRADFPFAEGNTPFDDFCDRKYSRLLSECLQHESDFLESCRKNQIEGGGENA